MSSAGSLDIPKLKAIVIEKWSSAPDLWPVKVMPVDKVLQSEQCNGGRPLNSIGGYFTCFRAIRHRAPHEMEDILGFGAGYLGSGASIWRFLRLPRPDEFELRGYTQLPDGLPFEGIVLRRSDRTRPQFFDNDGGRLTFIPGLGVEQWTLGQNVQIDAVEFARLAPGHRLGATLS